MTHDLKTSGPGRQTSRPMILLDIFLAILIIGIIAALAFPITSSGPGREGAKRARTDAMLNAMATGAEAFHQEYPGLYPTGDNATFVRVMSGKEPTQNRRGINFVAFKKVDLNATGQILDLWGTPIEITYLDDGRPRFRSAGADGRFDTADDLMQTTTKP